MISCYLSDLYILRRPPPPTLFPYTTLFRSPCEPQPKARRACECGRARRSRRRGEPVNASVRPPGLARVAPVLVTLLVVWMAGGLWLARRGAERHEVAVADTVAVVRALVDAAQRELRRESALLAKDPTIVEGALKRDWATLARGASPRMLALTLERTADLLLVLDATGAPLVQVPATPRVEVLALSRPAEAVTRVAVVNSYAYLVGLAPLPAGMVVVGRRVESLARVLEGLPSRPAVVALAGDLAVGGTLPGVPPRGWRDAARSQRVTVNGEPWLARPLDEAAGEGLWALVPEGPRHAAERRFWFVWALSLVAATGVALVARATVSRSVGTGAVGAGSVVAGSVVAGSARPPRAVGGLTKERSGSDTSNPGASGQVPDARGQFPEGRRQELEAVHAIAVATGGGDDLVATAERMLEIVCGVARMAFGGLYRFDPAAQTLVLVAHRGLSPEDVAELSVRPLDASHVGEALRLGHLVVTDLTRSRVLAPAVRERIAAGGYSTQLSLPITVNGAVWGVMALIGRERRTFDGDELTLLQAAAHQVGQAVARATLFEETRERSRRLETLTRLAQTLTATLSADEVIQRVVDAAAELFDSSVARLWLVEDDGAHVTLRASVGARAAGEGRRPFRVGEGLVGTVVATREPLAVADVLSDPRTRDLTELRAEGTASAAVVPLLIGDPERPARRPRERRGGPAARLHDVPRRAAPGGSPDDRRAGVPRATRLHPARRGDRRGVRRPGRDRPRPRTTPRGDHAAPGGDRRPARGRRDPELHARRQATAQTRRDQDRPSVPRRPLLGRPVGGWRGHAAHGAVRRRTEDSRPVGGLSGDGLPAAPRDPGDGARSRHPPPGRRERRAGERPRAARVGRDVRARILPRRAVDPAGPGHRHHDAGLLRAADALRALAGGPRDDDRRPARPGAGERAPVHGGPGAPPRDDDAHERRPDPLATGARRRADAAGGARGRAGVRRRHGRRILPRRAEGDAGAAGRLPRAAAPRRAVHDAADRARAGSRASSGVAGGPRRVEPRSAARSALRPRVGGGAPAALRTPRVRDGARRADRRAVRRLVAPGTAVPAVRDPARRGRRRAGGPRDGKRGAGAPDRGQAAGDGGAALREPDVLLDARPPGPAAPLPPSHHAGRRRGLGGRLAPRRRRRVARARRRLPAAARPPGGAPPDPAFARPGPILRGGGAHEAARRLVRRGGRPSRLGGHAGRGATPEPPLRAHRRQGADDRRVRPDLVRAGAPVLRERAGADGGDRQPGGRGDRQRAALRGEPPAGRGARRPPRAVAGGHRPARAGGADRRDPRPGGARARRSQHGHRAPR